jgi:dienelactone hydrolase
MKRWLIDISAVLTLLACCGLILPQWEQVRGAEPDRRSTLANSPYRSIREFDVLPSNSPAVNRDNLQKAIDWAAAQGAALFVEPSDTPYPVAGGLVLKANASLIGVHGPVGRGTRHPRKPQPVGSVLRIEDEKNPFLTVEAATQVRGVQFWYPRQTVSDPAKIIKYPPTIQVSHEHAVEGVTLSCLTFYGEYLAIDFRASRQKPCEQILIEHCYGYPLGGEFIRIDHCYDIPRILHCHVNPAVQRRIGGQYGRAVVDAVVAAKTFSFAIDHTDNAQLIDLFTFGVHGGIRLGPASYGQLTNFNLDCVSVGIHKSGDGPLNRNWQIAQGSIIANCGAKLADVHPIVIDGQGHTAIANVEAFSGPNDALSTLGKSQDFLLVGGEEKLTVSLSGCRMRNYAAAAPVTLANPRALVQLAVCVDKDDRPLNGPLAPALPTYAEHQDLTYYLTPLGEKRPVKAPPADWDIRRQHVLAHMQRVMGEVPGPAKSVPLAVKQLEEARVGPLVRRKIAFQSEPDDRVAAYIFLPPAAGKKLPAVLCLHQTAALGKGEPAGLGGNANLHYALHLAQRGYVTLAPDYPSFGEHPWDFDPRRGYASGTMKAIWDNMRAVDLLQSLPEVDAERIGVIGHSLGGHNALFTAAFEPRIKVIVSSCGFTRFHKDDMPSWTGPRYMPRIASVFGNDAHRVPFDFTEIVAALAPRPFLACAAVRDADFDVSGVRDVLAAAKPVYQLYGKAAALQGYYPDSAHDFPADARTKAYEFLDRYLK